MTYRGKIGRLPKNIRHQLNLRIEDGHSGADLVEWLNGQPEVNEVLKDQFEARPISEQNISDWKQSGHVHWLRQQEAQESAHHLLELADGIQEPLEEGHLTDRFAVVISTELTRLAMTLMEEESDLEKRWQRLCQLNRELSRLRRDDHRSTVVSVQQERWEMECLLTREKMQKQSKEERRHQMTEILLNGKERDTNASMLFGGGPGGREKAEMLYRLQCDLPIEDILDGTWRKEQTEARAAADAAKCAAAAAAEEERLTRAKAKQKPAKKPEKKQKSRILKAGKGSTSKSNPIPISETFNSQQACRVDRNGI